MPDPDLCSEEEVQRLVHGFHARARVDPALGPIFHAHVHDREAHLARMVDFWSSALRGTARFRGTPMPKHVALPGLSAQLFQRWLTLFGETTAELGNAAMARRANHLAVQIADSLWYGYEVSHAPETALRPSGKRASGRTQAL